MYSSSPSIFARASILVLASSSVVACAAQVTGDFFDGDAGSCLDDPSSCVDAHHSDSSVKHDAASHLDAGITTTDATAGDASNSDATSIDASSIDAAHIDSSAPDTSTTGSLIFDSIPSQSGASSRGSGDACGTQITVHTTTTISRISVKNTLTTSGNVKFLIFNTTSLVYASAPKAFTITTDSWKDSDPMSFTLQAGQTYNISGISDVVSSTWDYDTVIENTAAISSTAHNPNVTNYTTPILGSVGGADCGIRLYQ